MVDRISGNAGNNAYVNTLEYKQIKAEHPDAVFDFDDTKLSVHTLDVGLAGIEVYDMLRDEYDIQIEFGDLGNILAYLSIGDRSQELERLVSALAEIRRRFQRDGSGLMKQEYIDPEVVTSPQEAFYAQKISLPLRESIGHVCSEFVMCYPPGIPILTPGERITEEIIEYIANNIKSNIRELEGCLKRLLAYASLNRTSYDNIDVDLCEQALKEIFDQRRHKQITAELIMQTTCDYYNMSLSDLTGPTRKREITIPRQIAMFLTREMTGMSLPQIGTVFGGRDHTTVMHSIKTVEVGVRSNPNMEEIVNDIRHMVKDAR